MSEKVWENVKQAVLVAVLLAVLGKLWNTYEQVIELRMDVDRLYAIVSEMAQEE